MTSFLKPITSRLSRFFIEKPEAAFALALFALLLVHGSTIGLTDDEAYYWVLAQKPQWAYAYHPPMVAWMIALSQAMLGRIAGPNSALVVRLPSALCASALLGLALRWLRETGVAREKLLAPALTLLSLAGLFALSWMMVPDVPLFLGWTLCFVATWRICFGQPSRSTELLLGASAALAILSKYSGGLIGLSSLICIWAWAPRERRIRASAALAAGGILAAAPILAWNASHGWASILYQVRDRQEGSLSFLRWGRFWAVELLVAGPALVFWGLASVAQVGASRVARFVWVWAGPAALVYFLQPLWADFKPHWALIAWWPLALLLAHETGMGLPARRWARAQIPYGLGLGALALMACHVPVGNLFVSDPRLDVTNDLYGWRKLGPFLRTLPGNSTLEIPVIGSRYQTAAQAYFALGPQARVTMLPRDLKSRDEWPDLRVSTTVGPEWPALDREVLFVSDNRYDAPPEFAGARCEVVGRITEDRGGRPAKRIDVRECAPIRPGPRPFSPSPASPRRSPRGARP